MEEYVGRVITGKEFNTLFPQLIEGEKLIRLMDDNYDHNDNNNYNDNNEDIEIQKGLVVIRESSDEWITFLNTGKLYLWMNHNYMSPRYCKKVMIPDDCEVLVGRDKFMSTKIIEYETLKVSELSIFNNEDYCMEMIWQNYFLIRYIPSPSEKVQLEAVKLDGMVIEYILRSSVKVSKKVLLAAVRQNGTAIYHIMKSEHLINFMKDIEELQLEAVNQNGFSIKYIKNPSKKIQLAAINKNCFAIQFVSNADQEVQLAAVKQDGCTIKFIKNPSNDIQLAAVKQNGDAIEYIIKSELNSTVSPEVKLEAVRQNGIAIRFMCDLDSYLDLDLDLNLEIQLSAVRRNGNAIYWIRDPCEEVQLEAVRQNAESIEYIIESVKTVSEEVLLTAIGCV